MPDLPLEEYKEYAYTSQNGNGFVYAEYYQSNGSTYTFYRGRTPVMTVENVISVIEVKEET